MRGVFNAIAAAIGTTIGRGLRLILRGPKPQAAAHMHGPVAVVTDKTGLRAMWPPVTYGTGRDETTGARRWDGKVT